MFENYRWRFKLTFISLGRLFLILLLTDISQRKQAERELQNCISLVDEDGRFLTVNYSLAKSLNKTKKDLEGKSFFPSATQTSCN